MQFTELCLLFSKLLECELICLCRLQERPRCVAALHKTNKQTQKSGKKTALPWIEHNCFLLNKTENKQKQIKLWTAEWGNMEEFHLPSREFQEEIPLKRSGWDGFLFLDKIRALHLLGSKVTSQASTTSGPFNDVMGAKMVESSTYRNVLFSHCFTTSSMKMGNSNGPRMDPWGTDELMERGNEDWPESTTLMGLRCRYSWSQTCNLPVMPFEESFAQRPLCQTWSNAPLMSSVTMYTPHNIHLAWILEFKFQ